ncbi:uncharacterized protein METZ01_LOCUS15711 [marine metagenome]|uniref:Uncharacterized protein n=1 Tax=marine metagenome TaxID=408172 RepID=A0A381P919_9ZZZZ
MTWHKMIGYDNSRSELSQTFEQVLLRIDHPIAQP